MTTSNSATDEIIPPPQAKRLRAADLATAVGGRIQLVGIDAPPTIPAANTVGVVVLAAPTPVAPSFADLVAERVVERLRAAGPDMTVTGASALTPQSVTGGSALDEPPPILLTTTAAAKLLGCSLKAIYHRVAERQIPSSCIVRSGRRLLFHRTKLLAAMD